MPEEFGPDYWEEFLDSLSNVCVKAGRPPEEIKVIAVTKGFWVEEIRSAWDFGFRHFGENRVKEFLQKEQQLSHEPAQNCQWHMIGHLQSNKVRKIVDEFFMVHSVDRSSLIKEFKKRLRPFDGRQRILMQVNVSGEESKHGVPPESAPELMGEILESKYLEVEGLMTMAPFTDDKDVLRQTFADCRKLRDELETQFSVDLPELSMGMTNDYKQAIQEGATILRLGRALFGERE